MCRHLLSEKQNNLKFSFEIQNKDGVTSAIFSNFLFFNQS